MGIEVDFNLKEPLHCVISASHKYGTISLIRFDRVTASLWTNKALHCPHFAWEEERRNTSLLPRQPDSLPCCIALVVSAWLDGCPDSVLVMHSCT